VDVVLLLAHPLSNEEATKAVAKGLHWAEAEFLAGQLEIGLAELARYTGISESTFFRRRRSKRFTQQESDHLMRFGRLWALANEVFENAPGARDWLKAAQVGLGGRRPLEVAMTETGAREVETLLRQIDYGVLP
jgi:putative toxin-antitoxin system antitoxin component (TIGR02293 family)